MTSLLDARTYLRLPITERMLVSSQGRAPPREEILAYRHSFNKGLQKLRDDRQQQTKRRIEQVALDGLAKVALADGKFAHNFSFKDRNGRLYIIRIKTTVPGTMNTKEVEVHGGEVWDMCIRSAASWEERNANGLTPIPLGSGIGSGPSQVAIKGNIHNPWNSQAFSDVAGAIHGDFVANCRRGGLVGFEFAVYSQGLLMLEGQYVMNLSPLGSFRRSHM